MARFVFLAPATVVLTLLFVSGLISANGATHTAESWSDIREILERSMLEQDDSVAITYYGDSDDILARVNNAIEEIMAENGHLRLNLDGHRVSGKRLSEITVVDVEFGYLETKSQTAYVSRRIREIVARISRPGMRTDEKIKAAHDYVVTHLAYDTTYTYHSPYFALTKGVGTCNSYALLMYRMLREMNIETKVITGQSKKSGEAHAWNLVKVDGEWYHLDATWDDPVPDLPNEIQYNYYLLSDKQMLPSHSFADQGWATADYFEHVRQRMLRLHNTAEIARYKNLMDSLGMQYLLPENTATNGADLAKLVERSFAKGESSFTIRYLRRGVRVDRAEAILNAYVEPAARKQGVAQYWYAAVDYGRSETPDDILLQFSRVAYSR